MEKIEKRRHVTEEIWIALCEDTITPEEYMQILEHTRECTWCAEKLADVMGQENTGYLPPSYLNQEILQRTGRMDVQAAVTAKQTSKRLQLFLYSLKVGTAVAASIMILGLTANFREIGFVQLPQPKEPTVRQESILKKMNQTMNGVTEQMNVWTDTILKGGKEE